MGPIGSWDVANVGSMRGMFGNAHSFNQPIRGWNTASVRSMRSMFYGAHAFSEDLSGWPVPPIVLATARDAPFGAQSRSNVTPTCSSTHHELSKSIGIRSIAQILGA